MRALLAILLVGVLASPAVAATPVGAVSRVQGACSGTVEGTTRTLTADVPVHLAEEIVTGDGARLAVALDDGTVLTLGENARLVIDTFVYDPEGANSLSGGCQARSAMCPARLPRMRRARRRSQRRSR